MKGEKQLKKQIVACKLPTNPFNTRRTWPRQRSATVISIPPAGLRYTWRSSWGGSSGNWDSALAWDKGRASGPSRPEIWELWNMKSSKREKDLSFQNKLLSGVVMKQGGMDFGST